MKTKPSCSRIDPLASRLAAYSATAVVALATAPTAEAQSIFNLTTFSVNGGETFSSTPPLKDGQISNTWSAVYFIAATAAHNVKMSGGFRVHRVVGDARVHMNGSLVGGTGGGLAQNLAPGSQIGGVGRFFSSPGNGRALAQKSNFGTDGGFLPTGANGSKTGYVGFKKIVGTGPAAATYYGWLHVKVTNDAEGFPFVVTFTEKDGIYGAMGDRDSHIKVGQTAIPEPANVAGGLALFALGVVGVREFRRRRKLAA